MNIIDLLQEKDILDSKTASHLKDEVNSSKKKPEKVILEQKAVDEELLFRVKSEAAQIPLKRVDAKEIVLKVLELIPEDSARYYAMIPISYKNEKLEVGMVYPEDEKAQEALKFLARQGNFSYNISLVTLTTFESLIKQYHNLKGEMQKALEELEKEVGEVPGEGVGEKYGLEGRVVEDAPITKMVAVILRNAVEGEASDIHIEPLEDRIRVRFRSLGELHASLYLPLTVHAPIIARIKILSQMKIDEMRVPQDGRFSTTINGKHIDFRVSTFPTPLGEKVAIRILDPEMGLKSFEDLGLDGVNLKKVKEAAKRPFGLIIVSGPTGSGKSTTLYAILQHINSESINIVTIEDPVEYFIPGVNHSQVRPEIGYDFASGLRQILRQDPDVIMVGEIRDSETAQLAIHAALTGHIVLSTLHTNNAIGVIARLRDMKVEKYLLPSTLSVAIAQRLVRHLCEFCREKIQAPEEIDALIIKELENIPERERKKYMRPHFTIYKSKGCKKCGNTGYSGRIGLFEVFSITDKISNLILKEEISEIAIEQEARAQGMTTMRQDGILKVLEGITTIEEVIRVTAD